MGCWLIAGLVACGFAVVADFVCALVIAVLVNALVVPVGLFGFLFGGFCCMVQVSCCVFLV